MPTVHLGEALAMSMADDRPERGVLWRVERPGGRRPSYLFATIHVARPEWAFPGPMTKAAMAQADQFALEIDVLDPGTLQAATRADTDPRGMPANGSAPSPLSPEAVALHERIDAIARRECLYRVDLNRRTDAQRVNLFVMNSARADGLYPEYGIDASIASFARARSKPLKALEAIEQQVRFLKSVRGESGNATAQTAQLAQTVKGLEDGSVRQGLLTLADAWSTGNAHGLGEFSALWHKSAGSQLRARNEQRNRVMAATLKQLYDTDSSTFAAVGGLHMFGPDNLVDRLRAMGFTVTQLTGS